MTSADVTTQIRRKAALAVDVYDKYVAYLNRSHKLVEETYRLEKAGAFNGVGTAEGKTFAVGQLAVAGTALRDLIYTAWIRSGEAVPARP